MNLGSFGAKWQENIFRTPCKPIKIVEYRIGRYLSRRAHVSSCLRGGSAQVTRIEAVGHPGGEKILLQVEFRSHLLNQICFRPGA
jgi:hypothetical protein